MIVVDVETTGIDANKCSLASIGAIDFNHPENTFYGECRVWTGAHISEEALKVNGFTELSLHDLNKYTEATLIQAFLDWIMKADEHTVGGQNPFFDTDFLRAAAHRAGIEFNLPKRVIDLHSICYAHMIMKGLTPPISGHRTDINSDFIMKYVGLEPEPKPHVGINGAIWEAEAFSRLLYNKPLLDQFKSHNIPWEM